jgi:hypothetical protein
MKAGQVNVNWNIWPGIKCFWTTRTGCVNAKRAIISIAENWSRWPPVQEICGEYFLSTESWYTCLWWSLYNGVSGPRD